MDLHEKDHKFLHQWPESHRCTLPDLAGLNLFRLVSLITVYYNTIVKLAVALHAVYLELKGKSYSRCSQVWLGAPWPDGLWYCLIISPGS